MEELKAAARRVAKAEKNGMLVKIGDTPTVLFTRLNQDEVVFVSYTGSLLGELDEKWVENDHIIPGLQYTNFAVYQWSRIAVLAEDAGQPVSVQVW